MTMDAGFWRTLADIFKDYPGYLSLLAVIWMLFKAQVNKDATIRDLLKISTDDTERTMKLTTLIELLLSEKFGGRGARK